MCIRDSHIGKQTLRKAPLTYWKVFFTVIPMANSAENSAHIPEAATRTEFEKNIGKEYFKEAAWPMAGYVVTILLLTTLVDLETAGAWKYLVVLIPIIPMLFFLRAVIRQFGRIDEMQREAQLEGLALSFGVTIFAAITLGFLSLSLIHI